MTGSYSLRLLEVVAGTAVAVASHATTFDIPTISIRPDVIREYCSLVFAMFVVCAVSGAIVRANRRSVNYGMSS
jgi:hypothetical protein